MANHEAEYIRASGRCEDGFERGDDFRVTVGDVVVVEKPPAGESGVSRGFFLKEVGVEVEESRKILGCPFVRDVLCIELVEERLRNGLQLGGGLANGDKGTSAQSESEDLKVDVQTIVDKVVGPLVEGLDAVPPLVEVLDVRAVDVEFGAGGGDIRERLDCHGQDDAKRSRATTLERPKEVGVLRSVGRHKGTRGSEDLELEDVVGGYCTIRSVPLLYMGERRKKNSHIPLSVVHGPCPPPWMKPPAIPTVGHSPVTITLGGF